MKYISQINGFWNWRRLNPITSKQADLYFAILDCANSSGWQEQVTIPNTTLILMCNTNKTDLHRNRLELIQKRLITYQKGKKGNAGVYKINPLYETNNETNKIIGKLYGTNNVTYPVTNPGTNSVTNPGNIYRLDKDETRKEKTDSQSGGENESGVIKAAEYYREVTGRDITPNMYDLLGGYISDGVEPGLICALFDYAVEQGAKNVWKYTETAIIGNMNKGIYTLTAYQEAEERRKISAPAKKKESTRTWCTGNEPSAEEILGLV